MDIQKRILDQYVELYERPTFKEISRDTGIQVTRVFRLFNGSLMKLNEYEIFRKKVQEKMGFTESLEVMARECSLKLNTEATKELAVYLKRKIELWRLAQVSKFNTEKTLTA